MPKRRSMNVVSGGLKNAATERYRAEQPSMCCSKVHPDSTTTKDSTEVEAFNDDIRSRVPPPSPPPKEDRPEYIRQYTEGLSDTEPVYKYFDTSDVLTDVPADLHQAVTHFVLHLKVPAAYKLKYLLLSAAVVVMQILAVLALLLNVQVRSHSLEPHAQRFSLHAGRAAPTNAQRHPCHVMRADERKRGWFDHCTRGVISLRAQL